MFALLSGRARNGRQRYPGEYSSLYGGRSVIDFGQATGVDDVGAAGRDGSPIGVETVRVGSAGNHR